ncbi:MAG: NAD-dependent epimerase/dehydratase family protein, partial [Spirochaetota bacterium]
MKVMIIGGTGTISEPVVRRLIASGHEVLVFNRGKRATPPEGARLITGDRHDPAFAQTMRNHGPYDCVVDMICFTPDDARTDVEVFTGLTPQLVFTSTVDVYR